MKISVRDFERRAVSYPKSPPGLQLVGIHTATPNCTVLSRPIRSARALLRLQQQHGNRFVQRVVSLPGYSQIGETCGAASLVSALLIWDREHPRQGEPNHMVVNAVNLILTYLVQNRQQTIEGWNNRGINGAQVYADAVSELTVIRDHARQPGVTITQDEYRSIGLALYALYVDSTAGLSANDIYNMHRLLGLESGRSEATLSFDAIFSSSILTGLGAGRIAQVGWYVRTGPTNAQGQAPLGHHAFIIGRFATGEWFLSDQGTQPATEMTASSLSALRALIVQASQEGRYWLFTGQLSTILLGGWTGVRLIGEASGVATQAASLIPQNTHLAEVDVGAWRMGDDVTSGAFVSRHYTVGDARTAAASRSGSGAVVVEMPHGVYSVYETNCVAEHNLSVTGIDSSGGGLLTRHTFLSAYLLLRHGARTRWLQVY